MKAIEEVEDLKEKLAALVKPISELEEGLLVSATYDGDLRLAVLKFYDPKAARIWLWRDNTGHRPYCYTKLEMDELDMVRRRRDVVRIEETEKLDLLSDSNIKVRKIVATDPLAVGGGQNSIRDEIRAWEADIKYFENYAYDRGLRMGLYYKVEGGKVSHTVKETSRRVLDSVAEIIRKNPPGFVPYIEEWAELLGQPLLEFRRIALDIEVANEAGRVPDPENAVLPIIAVSFVNDGERLVYLLSKNASELKEERRDLPYKLVFFEREADLIRATFNKIMDYPVVVTFNGDDFDLRYLKHRAERPEIGIKEEENPITLERVAATLKHGIHIDLYQFFRNKSIQVYAFSNKYSEFTLGGVAEALLGKSKLEFEGEIGSLLPFELASYCLNDSQLAYELTSMSSSVVMKLLLVISRIGEMPMNDVSRLGVSNWIRSMLFYEHRKINALIPRQDELAAKGGASSQAIIKGKKYKGGLVIEPKPGVHFDVSVLDFASLYPSLIKVHNLSYETVNCPHDECKTNIVPDTSHWVCIRRKGITSLVTGSLRDLRVGHYKPLSKDMSLSKDEHELYSTVSQGLKVFLNACFTGDTDVVTPQGIRNIKSLKVGDEVVNINPDTLAIEIDKVAEVQDFKYRGELYHFNDRRYVDLMVTPNHRFVTIDRSRRGGVVFRTAAEVYNGTNIAIPKARSGLALEEMERLSLLRAAQKVGSIANLYSDGMRLSSWFRQLPPALRQEIRKVGVVVKNQNKELPAWRRSHYRLPASVLTEEEIDQVEDAGGFVLFGKARETKIPARYDSADFASFCGWFVSEGSVYSTLPKSYANGHVRGESKGIDITQSFGRGNPRGKAYRKEISELIRRLGIRYSTDSGNRRYFKIASPVLYDWVTANCYGDGHAHHDAFSKRAPDFVFKSRETTDAFFDSAYKGDGSSRGPVYSTRSRRLAEDMVLLASLTGAKSKIRQDSGMFRVVFKNSSVKLTHSGPSKHRYVKKIPFEGKVYCVTTERNHTVIAGRNGRFVHVGQSYGVMGFETFAFYCLPVAEATAALGRDAITRTVEKCRDLGINVVYGDTDSLFLQSPSKEQITTVTHWAGGELGVELDLDKVYRYIAFSSRKKNYFGVLQDGSVDIRGLTGKKSQTPEFLKKTFYEALDILSNVHSPTDFERARARTKELLTAMVGKLKSGEIPMDDLAFNVMMGKPPTGYKDNTPQHVKAAELLQKKGREIKAGEIISFVKTKTPPFVKPAELAKPDEIDVEKYVDYARSMFDQMLDALDFSFDEIMGATTLDLFWS